MNLEKIRDLSKVFKEATEDTVKHLMVGVTGTEHGYEDISDVVEAGLAYAVFTYMLPVMDVNKYMDGYSKILGDEDLKESYREFLETINKFLKDVDLSSIADLANTVKKKDEEVEEDAE